jgi:acetyl-CoA/propionyl-CoA carboxylase biotin carboxyl carrier protein
MLRVLVANRGVTARRLVAAFQALGMETVAAFCEPDVDRAYVEEADYPVYLGGRTVQETFLDPTRVLSAALDAGCDAIHPGTCFLAERPELVELASRASVAVVAPDAEVLDRVTDRFEVYAAARALGVPIIPTSAAPVGDRVEPMAAAAQLGWPLYVKAVRGGVMRHVTEPSGLMEAVRSVSEAAERSTGQADVYLQRDLRGPVRRIGAVVASDRHGTAMAIGLTDASLGVGRTWLEELGDVVDGELAARLRVWSSALVRALGWWGICTVRWAVTEDGAAFLLGISARLTTGFRMLEVAHGVDLIRDQWRLMAGERLGWDPADADAGRHVVQLRVVHCGADGRSRPPGEVTALSLPEDGETITDVEVGDVVEDVNDPILAMVTVSGSTRHAAMVRATAALAALRVDGVQTNLDALRRLLDDRRVWARQHHTGTAREALR